MNQLHIIVTNDLGKVIWYATQFVSYAAADRFVARVTEGEPTHTAFVASSPTGARQLWTGDAASDYERLMRTAPVFMGGWLHRDQP